MITLSPGLNLNNAKKEKQIQATINSTPTITVADSGFRRSGVRYISTLPSLADYSEPYSIEAASTNCGEDT